MKKIILISSIISVILLSSCSNQANLWMNIDIDNTNTSSWNLIENNPTKTWSELLEQNTENDLIKEEIKVQNNKQLIMKNYNDFSFKLFILKLVISIILILFLILI